MPVPTGKLVQSADRLLLLLEPGAVRLVLSSPAVRVAVAEEALVHAVAVVAAELILAAGLGGGTGNLVRAVPAVLLPVTPPLRLTTTTNSLLPTLFALRIYIHTNLHIHMLGAA